MTIQKFYRKLWTEQNVNTLCEWWPHFGTYGIEKHLPDVSRKQIKSKVNKLGLKLLPKERRLCIECKNNFQFSREAGLRCRSCYLAKRKDRRCCHQFTFDEWMKEVARSCRYRNKIKGREPSDITAQSLTDLWQLQNGRCCYSGLELSVPQFGHQRSPMSASLDRKDVLKGYMKDNVAWACWGCNVGKSTFSLKEYVSICRAVSSHLCISLPLES